MKARSPYSFRPHPRDDFWDAVAALLVLSVVVAAVAALFLGGI